MNLKWKNWNIKIRKICWFREKYWDSRIKEHAFHIFIFCIFDVNNKKFSSTIRNNLECQVMNENQKKKKSDIISKIEIFIYCGYSNFSFSTNQKWYILYFMLKYQESKSIIKSLAHKIIRFSLSSIFAFFYTSIFDWTIYFNEKQFSIQNFARSRATRNIRKLIFVV